MKNILITDEESLIKKEDFTTYDEVWLLSSYNIPRDNRIKYDEVMLFDNLTSNYSKLPALMTILYERFPNIETKENKYNIETSKWEDVVVDVQRGFTYEVRTKNKEQYYSRYCICDENLLKEVD